MSVYSGALAKSTPVDIWSTQYFTTPSGEQLKSFLTIHTDTHTGTQPLTQTLRHQSYHL